MYEGASSTPEPQKPGMERRQFPRIDINTPVSYAVVIPAYETGISKDISQGGMYVKTGNASRVNDHIEGIIDHEDLGKVIWLEGRVVRVNDGGMALTFTNVDVHGLNNLLIAKKALG